MAVEGRQCGDAALEVLGRVRYLTQPDVQVATQGRNAVQRAGGHWTEGRFQADSTQFHRFLNESIDYLIQYYYQGPDLYAFIGFIGPDDDDDFN